MTVVESLRGRGAPLGTTDTRKVAIGSGIGAAIEVYDFIGFGIASALYLGAAFFPSADPAVATLYAFLTLGIGFGVRPIGGIIAGYFGDRIGRKPVLIASLMVMGICTVIMGLLPTYQQAGVIAPVLLVLTRTIQGLAFGAEWGGAVLMTYEHAPLNQKGRFTGLMHAGFAVGLMLANIAFLASASLGNDWSWRIPFLASFVLIVLGMVLRSKLHESPAFKELKDTDRRSASPVVEVFRKHPRQVISGICLRIAEPAGYALAVTYMISYLHGNELADSNTTLIALLIASAIAIFATPLYGIITDKVGRKPLFIAACLLGVFGAFPLFLAANTGSAVMVGVIMIVAYSLFANMLVGVQGTLLPELFGPETRFSGASMSYQISAALSGFTPFVATWLTLMMGWMGAAVLLIGVCLLSLTAVLLIPESWSREHRRVAAKMMADAADERRQEELVSSH